MRTRSDKKPAGDRSVDSSLIVPTLEKLSTLMGHPEKTLRLWLADGMPRLEKGYDLAAVFRWREGVLQARLSEDRGTNFRKRLLKAKAQREELRFKREQGQFVDKKEIDAQLLGIAKATNQYLTYRVAHQLCPVCSKTWPQLIREALAGWCEFLGKSNEELERIPCPGCEWVGSGNAGTS